jgi:hypothetical protein
LISTQATLGHVALLEADLGDRVAVKHSVVCAGLGAFATARVPRDAFVGARAGLRADVDARAVERRGPGPPGRAPSARRARAARPDAGRVDGGRAAARRGSAGAPPAPAVGSRAGRRLRGRGARRRGLLGALRGRAARRAEIHRWLGSSNRASDLSRSVTSKSFRPMFGRIAFSRKVLWRWRHDDVTTVRRLACRRRVAHVGLPPRRPDCVFQVHGDLFVDAARSAHFSRFLNHADRGTRPANLAADATAPHGGFRGAALVVCFYATRDVAPGCAVFNHRFGRS